MIHADINSVVLFIQYVIVALQPQLKKCEARKLKNMKKIIRAIEQKPETNIRILFFNKMVLDHTMSGL